MPTVPRYSTPQVSEQGIPDVRYNANLSKEAFGGGESLQKTFGAIGDSTVRVSDVFQEAKKAADEVNVRDADLEASQLQTNLEIQIKQMRGKNAAEAPDFLNENWTKGVSDISKKLSSEEQRIAFERMAQARYLQLDKDSKFHMSSEFQKYDDEQTSAYVQNARNRAVVNFQDDESIAVSLLQQESEIQAHGDRHGVSPDVLKKNIDTARSATHSDVINRYLNTSNDLGAKNYYDRVKSQIVPEDAQKIEKLLEEGSFRGESQRKADLIFAKNKESMVSAIDSAKQIEDPKLRDEVTSRIKDMFSIKNAAEKEDIENLHKRATDVIDATGDWQQIPMADWSRFSLSERSSLKTYSKAKKEGTQPETNWNEYYNLKTMASSPSLRSKFMKENLMTYRSEMANTEFKELIDLQTGLRNGDDKTLKLLDGYRTDNQIVNDALESAGFDTGSKASQKERERVNKFRRLVDEQVIELQKSTGKKATNEDIQMVVDNLMVQGVTKKGIFWDTKKRVFETDDGEQIEIEIKDIPKSERVKIQEALMRRGMPVTDQNIINLYSAKIQGFNSGK